jgi:putative GTP pyrophosphokinase
VVGTVPSVLSKSQVKRAGQVLRRSRTEVLAVSEDEVRQAIEVVTAWRRAHAGPLNTATMALRSKLRTIGLTDAPVSQRLKERSTIIEKLVRFPNMQLSTMQDIGGCRGVVADREAAYGLAEQWQRHLTVGTVRRVDDYVAQPRQSGYRAIHVIVEYEGLPIEVQIRTTLQNEWASAVEGLAKSRGEDLKRDRGSEIVLGRLRSLADIIAEVEIAGPTPALQSDILGVLDLLTGR